MSEDGFEQFRLTGYDEIFVPFQLTSLLSLDDAGMAFIEDSRETIKSIIKGEDSRYLVVAGPCSIHDPAAGYDYALRLKRLSEQMNDRMFFVMRTYFEKPRTVQGWKGLVNDPLMDCSFRIDLGLKMARKFLLRLAELRLAAGTEALDSMTIMYYEDLISWNCIGARTSESQVHRNLASMLKTAVGFKNPSSGDLDVAVHSIHAASEPAGFLCMGADGRIRAVKTAGNPLCHLILRGTAQCSNYDEASVCKAVKLAAEQGFNPSLLIDCSHGNSAKDPSRQEEVLYDVLRQIRGGQSAIKGFMLESFLEGGAQSPGKNMRYGVSVTDPCLGWDDTERLLEKAYKALGDG